MTSARALILYPALAADAVRARVLAVAARPLGPLFRDRERRVLFIGVLSVLTALVLTCASANLLLAWGPLLLGVPHLLADVRYLVVRRALHRRAAVVTLVLLPAALSWVVPTAAVGLLAIAGAALAARTRVSARALLFVVGLALAATAWRLGRRADVWLAHAHNVFAIVLWIALYPRRSQKWVVAAFVAAALLIASGSIDLVAWPALRHGALDVNDAIATLGVFRDPTLAVRSVLLFAFAQSVHYAVWLRLVPEDDRDRAAPRPFSSSAEALARDVGWPALALFALVAAAFVAWGAVATVAARDGYLRLASFHGPLEIGVAALLFLERRR